MNQYFYSSLFSLPVVSFVNFLFYCIGGFNANSLLALKTFIWNFAFSMLVSIFYKRINVVGLAIFSGLLLVAIIGYIGNNIYINVIYLLFIVYLIKNIKLLIKISFQINWIILVVISIANFLLVLLFFPVGYITSSLFDSVYSGFNINTDSVYHISIAAMIKGYGIISHGIHGLNALEYHFGSHYILASLSNLMHISAFEAYAFMYPFFFIPLFNVIILLLTEELKKSKNKYGILLRILIYLFCLTSFGIFNYPSLINNYAVWTSFYVSESYLISLLLLFCLISIIQSGQFDAKFHNVIIILLVFLAILITKVSTGLIGLMAIVLNIFFSSEIQEYTKKIFISKVLVAIFFGIVFLFFMRYTVNGTEGTYFSPLYFINTYVKSELNIWLKVPTFILIHFIFAWMAIFIALKYSRKYKLTPTWYWLTLLISVMIGIYFITFYYIQGGSNFYFSNISMFIALPILMIYFDAYIVRKKSIFYLIIFIILISGFYAPSAIKGSLQVYFRNIMNLRHESPISYYMSELAKLSNDKSHKNSLIYIPRSEVAFWNILDCRTMPFIIPSFSEIPAIYAWPQKDCFDWLCGPRFHSNGLCLDSGNYHSDVQLLEESKRLGFRSVIIITKDGTRIIR